MTPTGTDKHAANDERARVVEYIRSELVGPAAGPTETTDGSPLDRYLLGVLSPQSAEAYEVHAEEEGEPSSADDEDSDRENPISMAFERLPASLGVSFFVRDCKSISCGVHAARYARLGKSGHNEKWERKPLAGCDAPEVHRLDCPSATGGSHQIEVLSGHASLHSLWRPMKKGFLVTVTLLNRHRTEDGRPDPSECLFQAGFACEAIDGNIDVYPRLTGTRIEAEEEELALLYRDRHTYAVGHGCAAMWDDSSGSRRVYSEAMPHHETYPVTTAADLGGGEAGRAAARVLSLRYLADPKSDPAALKKDLLYFVSRYDLWIDALSKDALSLPEDHASSADRLLSRLRVASERMHKGIASVLGDPTVKRAFHLATRAMLMQMVHSSPEYGGATRGRSERPYSSPEYDSAATDGYRWYPFQLAFMLLSAASVVDERDEHRDTVDLIWFPTGGGKTEAYLWVAAMEMFLRRLRHGSAGAGTAVIKRYTLRLLTSQQFQRAATLISACEHLRRTAGDLGDEAFSLGLWIGIQSTANTLNDAKTQYEDLLDDSKPENPFQLQRCPWCGTRIVPAEQSDDPGDYGVRATSAQFDFFCPSDDCPFHDRLPIAVVDEEMFRRAPTMLIGTIDKFARLAWDNRATIFFGTGQVRPPSLIIQDELHLISGPLGTIAGVYEAALDCLLRRDGHRPKIIAATATIRRAADQAKRLYARDVAVFPPSGLSVDDSFFSRIDRSGPGRLYVGVMGQGHTSVTSLVRTAAAASQAPIELGGLSKEVKDAYWTLLIYHNSKRELGKTMALARDDIPARVGVIATDESKLREIDNVEELSANVAGRRIPEVLLQLDRRAGDDAIDILPCTNMISVGVDVKRLGIMMVIGQPKTTAEYIQATSRVGRSRIPGLVITMYSPTKPRDRSHYESFVAYHDALYRWVEPTSVTPFALPSRERALHAALVIVARHAAGLPDNADAQRFDPEAPTMRSILDQLGERMAAAESAEAGAIRAHLERLTAEWAERARRSRDRQSAPLVYSPNSGKQFEPLLRGFESRETRGWRTLNSMRNVDSQSLIYVKGERTS
jgi:hypothetical protein